VFSRVYYSTLLSHLEENASRILQDKVGAVLPVRQKILHDLFGSDGLSSADNTYRFDELAHNIISNCETTLSDFTSYLTTKLIPALHPKVGNPRLQHGTLPLNCEAIYITNTTTVLIVIKYLLT